MKQSGPRARTEAMRPIAIGRRARSGFTLIEVLIATFIFALGLLGLLALFAGAAVQQQAASQVTNSVFASNAAEALVGRVAGRIEYRDNNNQPNPTEFDNLVPLDQWKVLKHHVSNSFDATDPATHTGTLRLRPDGTPNRASFFFVAKAPEQLPLYLYDRPDQVTQNGGGAYTRTGNQAPFTNLVKEFAVSRVHRESLNLIVVRTEEGTVPDPSAYRDIFYTRRDNLPPAYDNAANRRTMVAFSPSSFVPSDMVDINDYIVIDLADRPNVTYKARVEDMRIDDVISSGGARRVDSVWVPFYEWRSEDIVSLNDRLVSRPDEKRLDNRRPVLCYSLLYRRTSSNTTQVAVFTYSLKAPSSRAVFMPVESEAPNDPQSPLERVRLRLNYDDERKEYFVENFSGGLPSIVQDTDFALRNGAVLLVEGEDDGDPAGSDLPVRVVDSVDTDNDGSPDRGYLDRGPRANGKSYLDPLPTDTQVIWVWTIKPTVESEDGSIWRLDPIDTRVLQTG